MHVSILITIITTSNDVLNIKSELVYFLFCDKKGNTFSQYTNIIDIKEVKELSASPKIASFPSPKLIFSFENSPRISISFSIDPNCNILSFVKS